MTRTLWTDIETYSEVSIRDGTDNYSRAAEIMLWAYAVDDAPVQVWDVTAGEAMPRELREALADESTLVVAHNAAFEASVFLHSGYSITPSRYRCTMAQALAHGLPGALDKLCEIFGIGEDKAKLKDGNQLVQLFCKPQPKGRKLRRATRATHPTEWARFIQYCGNDVEAMRAIARKMPNWNYHGAELALWHLDQRINQRGIPVDLDLVEAAIATAERVKAQLAGHAQEITDGEVAATTQRDKLLLHIAESYDIIMPDLRGSTLERLLKSDADMPPVLRELFENRLAASSTSVSKYKRFAQLAGPDGRLRNTLQFCGAARTGRWAGRGVQLQNLPRPTLKQKAIDAGIKMLKADCADLLYDNPMELMQSAVRGCIIAPPGKKLVVADLSNIEGRMLAWLAGEEWKIKAFADFDAGEGHDLYALAYAKAFNVTPEQVMENKKSGDGLMRQIGKVMELMLQYAGGVGAFITGAATYGIDLDAMANAAISADIIPPRIWHEAEKAHQWAEKSNRTYGLAPSTYIVCDAFKRLWREAHPAICKFWKAVEQAVRSAIRQPGKTFHVRSIKVVKTQAWLRILLPSGRSLCYPSPKIDEDNKISYMGINQYSRKWQRLHTYDGKLTENITQAASRDVIAYNLPHVEAAGYEVLVTVHDEDITAAPDTGEYNADHLAAIMATNPPWAKGLPLAAAGFEAYSYRKE